MWWSERCFQLLGMKEGTLEPSFPNWKSLVHPDDAHRLENAGTEQCSFVKDGYLAVRMRCSDETYRKFEYRAAFVMDDQDRPKSMMGSFALIPASTSFDAPQQSQPKILNRTAEDQQTEKSLNYRNRE